MRTGWRVSCSWALALVLVVGGCAGMGGGRVDERVRLCIRNQGATPVHVWIEDGRKAGVVDRALGCVRLPMDINERAGVTTLCVITLGMPGCQLMPDVWYGGAREWTMTLSASPSMWYLDVWSLQPAGPRSPRV